MGGGSRGARSGVAHGRGHPGACGGVDFDPSGVMMGSSPWFDMYGCDFGWGMALAARSSRANKFDGKASLYPRREGGGSIDAELMLTPEHMA